MTHPFKILTTLAELAPYHLGPSDVLACTCPRHDKPFIAIAEPAAALFRTFRRLDGKPRQVVSSTRCPAHQSDLVRLYKGRSPVASNIKAATHVAILEGGTITKACVAFDVRNDGSHAAKLHDRDLLRRAGVMLFSRQPRIGWKGYGFGLVHADVAFLDPRDAINHVPGVEW